MDEVATDTATRGALKDDTTFKSLRDVIKKGNRVLEGMLVRRERRYTLFFRLVPPQDEREIAKIKSWNHKVDKAIGKVTDGDDGAESVYSDADSLSVASGYSEASSSSAGASMMARGRQLLPTAGRVRARRATPTPTLRNHRNNQAPSTESVAAEDGFSTNTVTPITKGNLSLVHQEPQQVQQQQQQTDSSPDDADGAPQVMPHSQSVGPVRQELAPAKPMEAKDELIDVIKNLKTEKQEKRDGQYEK